VKGVLQIEERVNQSKIAGSVAEEDIDSRGRSIGRSYQVQFAVVIEVSGFDQCPAVDFAS
jgi:hypothetical protein